MSETNTYGRRPVAVTILAVLLGMQALLQILAGIFLIAERNDASLFEHVSASSDTLLILGIAAIVIGLITALVAFGLGRASGFARGVAAAVAILNLASGIYSFFALDGVTRASALFSIIIAALVLYVLYGNRGSQEYFAR